MCTAFAGIYITQNYDIFLTLLDPMSHTAHIPFYMRLVLAPQANNRRRVRIRLVFWTNSLLSVYFKGTVSLVYNCLKVVSFKSQQYRHVAPDMNIFFYSFFNFILVFEVLMPRLQNHSTYHFYFEYALWMLHVYSNLLCAHSKYSGSNISMNTFFLCPIWCILLLLQQHRGGANCCSMRIQNVLGVAQCSFKIWRELLYFTFRRLRHHNRPS